MTLFDSEGRRSKVNITTGRRGGEGILVDAEASEVICGIAFIECQNWIGSIFELDSYHESGSGWRKEELGASVVGEKCFKFSSLSRGLLVGWREGHLCHLFPKVFAWYKWRMKTKRHLANSASPGNLTWKSEVMAVFIGSCGVVSF